MPHAPEMYNRYPQHKLYKADDIINVDIKARAEGIYFATKMLDRMLREKHNLACTVVPIADKNRFVFNFYIEEVKDESRGSGCTVSENG